MRNSPRHAYTAATLLLLAITASIAHAQVTLSVSKAFTSASTTGRSTCPSRSLNYITQTLPQQCFTTSWASKPMSQDNAKDKEALITITPRDEAPRTPETAVAVTSPESSSLPPDSAGASTFAKPLVETSSTASTVPTVKNPSTAPEAEQQTDTESPLDNVNFLSFEEWKRQNLAKAGQSAESLGGRAGGNEPRRRPGGINNALDSLGEDTEIEIDFGGFVNPGTSQPIDSSVRHDADVDGSTEKHNSGGSATVDENPGVRKKGKDAGKTCKERSNYASFDCAATMLKTNPESKGSNAVLVENKDSYMLNTCSAKNKFFIVELCDDILIDTVVLANFEFFSSMFRTFRVSVSDRYPVKPDKWKDLGIYEARNSREIQAFLIENPLIWARYLRVEFLTHFGNEYYCPLSLLRVHGTTMMEEFNHDLKRTGTDEDIDNEVGESEEGASIDIPPGVISAQVQGGHLQETSRQATEAANQSPSPSSTALIDIPSNKNNDASSASVTSSLKAEFSNGFVFYNFSISKQMEDLLILADSHHESCRLDEKPADLTTASPVSLKTGRIPKSTKPANSTDPVSPQTPTQTGCTSLEKASKIADASPSVPPLAAEKDRSGQTDTLVKSSNQTSTFATKTQSSSTQPANANPTMQESFFKSVHKRLQLLESNSTLSLQYIEEQSRILRDAFSKVEKRQLAKSTNFLETLNKTVLTELRNFRTQYDQIWQSTVLELSSQREQSQQEVLALSARLSLLADEIVFQKRMVILQFILVLLCLGLAIFSRSTSSAAYLELPPLVQNALGKSSLSVSGYTPQFETPPASPSSTRPSSGYGLFRGLTHRRGRSDESQANEAHNGTKSPNIEYSPPTPPSQGSPEDRNSENSRADSDGNMSDGFPRAEAGATRQTRSSPATPSGQRAEPKEFVEGPSLRPGVGR